MLRLENVSLFIAGKLLINEANLTIPHGARIAVTGRNGSGKSHLMDLLAGNITPDGGERVLAEKNVNVLLVKQELTDDDQTPLEYLRNNDRQLQRLEDLLVDAPESKIEEISNEIARLEEERYENLAPKVLMGLGLKKDDLDKPMKNLSGGYRMRIAFSMSLILMPEILLLDEPTNHLDLESTQWLIGFLKDYPKTSAVVVVTHDIKFLLAVTNTTVHLKGGTLTQYGGNYLSLKEMLEAKDKNDEQMNAVLEKKIEQKKKVYFKFRDLPAKRAAQAVDQLRQAKILEEKLVEIVEEEPVVSFQFPDPAEIKNPAVKLAKVSVGYGEKAVLSSLDLSIQSDAKIGLLGRNGEGKSTFIKLIAGKLRHLTGEVDFNPRLKVAYFSQDLTDELDVNLTVYEQYKQATGLTKEEDIRHALAKYAFSHDKIGTRIDDLSGGERSRLMFALICARSPNLIILDEPTNHLDLESKEELVKAISSFKGSILLVSHDLDLHEKTMKQFWLVDNGSVQPYTKGLKQYLASLLNPADKASATKTNSGSGAVNAKPKLGGLFFPAKDSVKVAGVKKAGNNTQVSLSSKRQ